MHDPIEILRRFTSATSDEDEARLNRVWYVKPWLLATDGSFVAGIRVSDSALIKKVPALANDFPQFARECKSYLEGAAQFASSMPRVDVERWAGDYDEALYASTKTRPGTTWGFPFDTNRVAKALQYLFPQGVPLDVDVCTGGEDGDGPPAAAVTRCTLCIRTPSYCFALARAREGAANELQPIADMLDDGDEAFDDVLEKLSQ